MKKTFFTISLLMGLSFGMMAQLDSGRTSKTKIIDALAMMPAQNSPAYSTVMADLVSTGEAGLAELTAMRETAQGEMRIKLDYALNSLADYAGQMKDTTYVNLLQQVYMDAIRKNKGGEPAVFYMKQLKTTGTNRCVGFLQSYLANSELRPFASQALAAIDTPEAEKALLAEFAATAPDQKKYLIVALGEMQADGAEDLILAALPTLPEADKMAAYYALNRCGGKKSLSVLQEAASKNRYAYNNNGVTENYILLAKRLGEAGDVKSARKVGRELMKASEKNQNTPLRCAAFDLLFRFDQKGALDLILDAIKDPARDYRNTALQAASPEDNAQMTAAIVRKIPKANPETTVDLLYWVANNQIAEALPVVIPLMKSPDKTIAATAMHAAGRIGGNEAIGALADLMVAGSAEEIKLAKTVLGYTQGDLSKTLMGRIEEVSPEGKAAILTLVASQKDTNYVDRFLNMCKDQNPTIRQTALTQLNQVVTPTHLPELFKMLRGCGDTDVKPVQNAVIAAIRSLPAEKRFTVVNREMKGDSEANGKRYFRVLTAAPGAEALRVIESGCKGTNPALKDAAVEALCEWNGPEALDPLFTLCESKEDAGYFDRTWSAYTNKVATSQFTKEKKLIFLRKALEVAKTKEQKQRALREIRKTNTYLGLLTAGKYLDDPQVREDACQAVMNIALNNPEYAGGEVNVLLDRVTELLDNPDKGYQQEAIRKYRAETKDKPGFVALFNGKDLSGWKGLVGNPITRAKMSEGQLKKAQQKADEEMRQSWGVENGVLVFNGKGDNLCTTRPYGDFEMYVDWCLDPAGPEADAGIYLRGTPQVQIWDTARVNVGAQVGSGGLYNNQKHLSQPVKVADNRLGEWNSFFIRMIGERVSVWLNGEKVVDNVIMENYWDRTQPVAMLEQLELQAHGSKVAYRDIYLREIPRVQPFELSAQERKDGFKVLFDGTSMFNWTGNTKDYIAEEGCIVLYPQNGGGGNLYTKEEYGDFVFRFDFMLTPGANNGLGIRTPMEGDAAYVGMELQILDNESPIYSKLEKYQYHGSVYGVIPSKRGFLKEPGEWNTQEVIAKGDQIKVILNGEVILDGNIREAGGNGTLDKRQHPGLFNKKGHIGFLGHGSVVKFKNIRVKKLD